MPIERTNFDEIEEADLQELIEGKIPEGTRIDFKRDVYGRKDRDKKEAMKDVSAFMNLHGGHLIIGMDEKDRIAEALPGLTQSQADKEIEWLTNLINSGIEPHINVPMRAIELKNGNYVVILRIPPSWNPPHRVKIKRWNKFWIRDSNGAHEASMQELNDLFSLSSGIIEKIRDFREERIRVITGDREGPHLLRGTGQFIMHIVPLSSFSSTDQLDLKMVEKNIENFLPLDSGSMNNRYNFEGFLIEGPEQTGYTQIFRNGIIEATKAAIVNTRNHLNFIPGIAFEKSIFISFPKYIEGLGRCNVLPPFVIMLTLNGVKGVTYAVKNGYLQTGEPIDRSLIRLPECIIEEYGSKDDYHRSIKPAFDTLWNTVGYDAAETFNEDGIWIGG